MYSTPHAAGSKRSPISTARHLSLLAQDAGSDRIGSLQDTARLKTRNGASAISCLEGWIVGARLTRSSPRNLSGYFCIHLTICHHHLNVGRGWLQQLSLNQDVVQRIRKGRFRSLLYGGGPFPDKTRRVKHGVLSRNMI